MASKTISSLYLPLLRRPLTTTCSLRAPLFYQTALPRRPSSNYNLDLNHLSSPSPSAIFFRAAHSIPRPPQQPPRNPNPPSPDEPSDTPNESFRPDPKGPAYYQLSFTCIPCGHRSHHNVSKQAYHHGSTLITCPGCRNRHVISDHLDIFGDRKITVEDLMRERGRLVKRGSLGEDGDIEFWPDEEQQQQQQQQDEGSTTTLSLEGKEVQGSKS